MARLDLPPETWLQIIECVAYIPDYPSVYLDSDQPGDAIYSTPLDYTSEVRRSFEGIRSLSVVNKLLHDCSAPFFFETVQVTKEETLWKLIRSLQTNFQFKEDFSSYTRRLVIIINDGENGRACPIGEGASQLLLIDRWPASLSKYSAEHMDRICNAISEIVCCCRQLSHFSCTLPWFTESKKSSEKKPSSHMNGHYTSGTEHVSSCLLSNLRNVRTLRIGHVGKAISSAISSIDEFPNLHTLQGPWDVIFFLFRKIRLPSLCNVILGKNNKLGISSEEFFKMHGNNIKSLVSLHNFGEDFLLFCPNLQDFVVDILDCMSFVGENSQVRRLGLFTSNFPPSSFWDHFFRYLTGYYGPYMTNLEVVRLVNGKTCRDLKQSNALGLRLWDRRFRDRDVRLEDEQGALLVNSSQESVSVIFHQLNINDL